MLIDIKTLLRSKALVLIIAISAIARIASLILLPHKPSPYAPDEATYARLAKYVSESLPVQEFPLFGPGLYLSSRSFILPSSLLIKMGINELDAIRIVSSFCGIGCLIILSLTHIAFIRMFWNTPVKKNLVFEKESIFILSFFAFLPSNFIWSILGLRESVSQFWIVLTFYLLLKVSFSGKRKMWKYAIAPIISLMLAFGARPETALLFSIVLIFFSLYLIFSVRIFLPIIVVLIGLILGQAFTATSSLPSPNSVFSNKIVDSDQEAVKGSVLNPIKEIQNDIGRIRTFEEKRNVNALDAESALPQSSCVGQSSQFQIILKCNFVELPYRLFAFLFRPLIFFDRGSTTLNFAAVENLGWILLFASVFFIGFRRTTVTSVYKLRLFLGSYALAFSLAAALYEGNLGTAFRHKSSILWPLTLILLMSVIVNAHKKYPKSF